MAPIRFRHLAAAARSAAHAKLALEGGELVETSGAMEAGSATHALLFGTGPVVAYHAGKVRSGRAWEEFQQAHEGALILTARDYERAARMADAVRADRLAMEVLALDRAAIEQTYTWEWLGHACAGTPDVRAPDHIAELKTTACSEPGRFGWQVRRLAYHAALAWYLDGALRSGLGQPSAAYIVAVESSPPHPVTVHRLTARTLEIGARLVRLWMERLVGAEAAGQWPGYTQSIVDLDLPGEDDGVVLDFGGTEASV